MFLIINKKTNKTIEKDGFVFKTESYSEALAELTTAEMSDSCIIINTDFCTSKLVDIHHTLASKLQLKILSEK